MDIASSSITARIEALRLPRAGTVDFSIGNLEDSLASFAVDMDPPYQRGHVWSPMQQSLFLGALICNDEAIPRIIIRKIVGGPGVSDRFEVLDGKQRLTAARTFLANQVPAVLADGTSFYLRDLDRVELRKLRTGSLGRIRVAFVDIPDDITAMKVYIALNRGGTVHTDAEIERVQALIAAQSDG